MPSTEDRVRKLVVDNIEIDGKPLSEPLDLSTSLADLGVNSVELVAMARLIQQEFDIQFEVEDCVELKNLAEVVAFVNSKSS